MFSIKQHYFQFASLVGTYDPREYLSGRADVGVPRGGANGVGGVRGAIVVSGVAGSINHMGELLLDSLPQFFPSGKDLEVKECKIEVHSWKEGNPVAKMDGKESEKRKVREEIRIEQNRYKKIKKITRYPDTEDLEPLNDHKFSETLTKEVIFDEKKLGSS
ncbi:hypothetical protein Tco_0862423 [Tanacetum coccineum]